jgi:glycosyltransferase involved in cell wall biosynthesis
MDLTKRLPFTEHAALQHYLTLGKYETRRAVPTSANQVFDWRGYVALYPDLAHINTEAVAINHFLKQGYREGRSSPCVCAHTTTTIGVNVIGYPRTEFGLGEACRRLIGALIKNHVPLCIYVIPHLHTSSLLDDMIREAQVPGPPDVTIVESPSQLIYGINIIVSGVDLFVKRAQEPWLREIMANKYNIGYIFWELEFLPDSWRCLFSLCDEMWAATTFLVRAFSHGAAVAATSHASHAIPVLHMPIPMELPPAIDALLTSADRQAVLNLNRKHMREKHRIPINDLVCIFIFDFVSFRTRKNPDACIEAFERAYGGSSYSHSCHSDVTLVIKCINASPHDLKWLKERTAASASSKRDKVHIFVDHWPQADLFKLILASDVYLSLHRSEGLGLTILEAMLMEKIVVSTNYSGNVDFCTETNSLPVAYDLVAADYFTHLFSGADVQKPRWANPRLDDVVNKLQRVQRYHHDLLQKQQQQHRPTDDDGDKKFFEFVGQRARADILRMYNSEKCGAQMLKRLTRIANAL